MLEERKCIICGNFYTPKSAIQKCCSKECVKKKNKKYSEKYISLHKESLYKNHKEYYYNNYNYKKFDQIICKICGKYFTPKYHNEKCCSDKCKKININNNKHKYYIREINKSSSNLKMKIFCRHQIRRCLFSKKTEHTFDILGYTPEKLKQRIEFQLKPDMNWNNYGILWNIDHRKPLSKFDFLLPDKRVDYKKIQIANSLANLKPLYIKDNCSKGAKSELDI